MLGGVVKHGLSGYVDRGCRCDVCRAAKSRANRLGRRRRVALVRAGLAEPPEHGKSSYENWGCRCETCSAAHAETMEAQRQRRAALIAAGAEPPSHGLSGYRHWGCRCDVCREAATLSERRRYLRRTRGQYWEET
jgi:hypothetical protein